MLIVTHKSAFDSGRRRGSELVRERADIIAENASSEIPSSRTSEASPGTRPRPAGRSLKTTSPGYSGLTYNAERSNMATPF
ncbi:hypothetical protein CU666_00620 [Pseudomonas syringae pv. actinidifoliorum]|nr:hypothetical protein [Pseudomonas syringae pv. actinidifoliorum]